MNQLAAGSGFQQYVKIHQRSEVAYASSSSSNPSIDTSSHSSAASHSLASHNLERTNVHGDFSATPDFQAAYATHTRGQNGPLNTLVTPANNSQSDPSGSFGAAVSFRDTTGDQVYRQSQSNNTNIQQNTNWPRQTDHVFISNPFDDYNMYQNMFQQQPQFYPTDQTTSDFSESSRGTSTNSAIAPTITLTNSDGMDQNDGNDNGDTIGDLDHMKAQMKRYQQGSLSFADHLQTSNSGDNAYHESMLDEKCLEEMMDDLNEGEDGSKKTNHSEIEKRRRDRMNNYIKELSKIIPICSNNAKKLDKLTVLRMAVQHMKMIRGNINAFTSGSQVMPSFLSNQKLHELIIQIAEGFLFVVSCDRGKLMFVSESVSSILNYNASELLGQNLFDILHPKDIAKVKEQLTGYDLNTKERLVDAKTMLPVDIGLKNDPLSHSRMSPGARRSFFCRIKCKSIPKLVKKEADTTTGHHSHHYNSSAPCGLKKKKSSSEKKYCVIHCMGYIKSWMSSASVGHAGHDESEREATEDSGCQLSCLVAVGRTIPQFTPPTAESKNEAIPTEEIQFVSRHAMDGKFLFVDQRAVFILGYLPQELVGTSIYEYCHPIDVRSVADSHRAALAILDDVASGCYRFKTKSGSNVCLVTKWSTFKNPWTKEFEFLVARHTVVAPASDLADSSEVQLESDAATSGRSHNWKQFNQSTKVGQVAGHTGAVNKLNKNGGTSSGNSSSSEARVQKMLSSDRVNLWKIGKQIAEEAIQKKSSNDDSNGSSNGNYSMTSSPLMMAEPSDSTKTVTSNNGSLTASHSPHMGQSASTTGNGNGGNGSGSDSGGSGASNYSNFYARSGLTESSPGNGSGTSSMASSASALQSEQKRNFMVRNIPQNVTTICYDQTTEQQNQTGSSGQSSGASTTSASSSNSLADPLMIAAAAAGVSSSVGDLKICDDSHFNHSNVSNMTSASSNDPVMNSMGRLHQEQNLPPLSNVTTTEDESAMALIMSILESDSGFGGNIDFNNLSWPTM